MACSVLPSYGLLRNAGSRTPTLFVALPGYWSVDKPVNSS
jgi:hypothetical protein